MFCPQCGTEIGNKRFCYHCGASSAVRGRLVSPKNQWVALALCIFFGFFGVHRFYVGKTATGILYILSGGGFGIGWLIDAYHIAIGTFRDKAKLPLKKEVAPPPKYIPEPPPAYHPPPPVILPNVAETVKQAIAPVMGMAEQFKRVFVPGAAEDQIPWDSAPVQPPAPPPSPEESVVKPDLRTPLGRCAQAVLDYLQNNESTPFFREKLKGIAAKLVLLAKRSGATRDIIVERFGSGGLTYNKFTAPVAALEEHSIRMAESLLSKMKLFDEEDCKRRIQELLAADKYKEMQEYMALETNYKDSAEQVLSTLDDALLKLDKLIYEMAQLDEAGLDQATHVLEGIDELIRDTPHYGETM